MDWIGCYIYTYSCCCTGILGGYYIQTYMHDLNFVCLVLEKVSYLVRYTDTQREREREKTNTYSEAHVHCTHHIYI